MAGRYKMSVLHSIYSRTVGITESETERTEEWCDQSLYLKFLRKMWKIISIYKCFYIGYAVAELMLTSTQG